MVKKFDRIYNVSRAFAKISKQSLEKVPSGPATFEEAITATGFGKFNYVLLLLGALPTTWAVMIAMSNVAQIIPSLKCDFHLSISQIGMLNSSPFIGNILSPFLWGYLADTMGRRKLMIYTALADAVCIVLCAFSINMEMLVTFKFLSGFVIMAPSGIIMSYLSECHNNKNRSRMILWSGILVGFANLFLPLLAWAILPIDFHYIRSWQLYLLICAIPSLVTSLTFMALPESPKFLFMTEKHDEALKVFQQIYAMNTGQPANSYPIITLLCENKPEEAVPQKHNNTCQSIYKTWNQFKPLFLPPYLNRIILCVAAQLLLMQGVNTFRIWLPEIFTLMDKYNSNNTNGYAGMCQVIGDAVNKTYGENMFNETETEQSCTVQQSSDEVFFKLCIIGACSVVMYIIVIIATSCINRYIVLGFLLFISGISGIALIWLTDPILILLISGLYTAQTGVALVTLITIVVELFPTSFRTLTVLIAATSGRVGSILGNLVFPMLLVAGCAPPFVYIGSSVLACIIPLVLLSSAKVEDL